jgi:hypothetical protein
LLQFCKFSLARFVYKLPIGCGLLGGCGDFLVLVAEPEEAEVDEAEVEVVHARPAKPLHPMI